MEYGIIRIKTEFSLFPKSILNLENRSWTQDLNDNSDLFRYVATTNVKKYRILKNNVNKIANKISYVKC